jgi:hypothetical protein
LIRRFPPIADTPSLPAIITIAKTDLTKYKMKYKNIREEELKNKVGADWFRDFDTTEILGNIDFTVFPKQTNMFGNVRAAHFDNRQSAHVRQNTAARFSRCF